MFHDIVEYCVYCMGEREKEGGVKKREKGRKRENEREKKENIYVTLSENDAP